MLQRLPVDIQTFADVRENNLAYVDKTGMIAELLDFGKYFFLSRPRRFGKSLFVTTLKSFFEGKKELFAGLAIENRSDWEAHPVIHLDFSKLDLVSDEALRRSLHQSLALRVQENQIPVPFDETDALGEAFEKTVLALFEKTGRKTVLLVDEYDSPITHWLEKPDLAQANRQVLRSFFSGVKAMDAHLRFVFITGVSKFAKVSVFSAMNNMLDISLTPRFNSLLGFTEAEIEANFSGHLVRLADAMQWTHDQLMGHLRFMYNGYSWTGNEKVYNPFSLMRSLHFEELGSHWFSSGSPSFLINEIRRREILPQDLENIQLDALALDASDIQLLPVEAVLFQTGYLTVTAVERDLQRQIYTLNFPNHEVKDAFFAHLLPAFAETNPAKTIPDASDLRRHLLEGNTEAAGNILRSYLAHIPGKLHVAREKYYQSIFYMALSLAGMKVDLEKWVSTGILDGVLELRDKVYFIEFKYAASGSPDSLAQTAIAQIKQKDYALAWQDCGKALFAFGIGVAGRKAGFAVKAV